MDPFLFGEGRMVRCRTREATIGSNDHRDESDTKTPISSSEMKLSGREKPPGESVETFLESSSLHAARSFRGSFFCFAGGVALLVSVSCGSSDDGDDDSSGDGGSANVGDGDLSGDGDEQAGDGDGSGDGDGDSPIIGESPTIGEDCAVFPADNPWNLDISELPIHPNSDNFVASVGLDDHMHPDFGTVWDGAPIGIPYVVVDSSEPFVDIEYDAYGDESTPGPFPLPLDAPIEGGPSSDGDRHAIAVDAVACMLYEIYRAFPGSDGWTADSGVAWDLSSNATHPEGCTSADAAGLPIFPGLVRYDEVVEQGEIKHALRFTVSQSQRAYIHPATHYASSNTDPDLPPMGLRFRMRADYDCSGYSTEAQVICAALKRYGMIVADNGSDWYLSGAPDSRWNDDNLGDIKSIPGSAFEVVDTGDPIVTDAPVCVLP